MPKILEVKVWGFESHIDTHYELAPGLTVVTGPSDCGKTSGTLRALRWLAKGEPSGEEFLHTVKSPDGATVKQADEAGVYVKLDNGVEVTKTRRNKKTKYWVTGYAEPFEKAEVPEAVREALGIRTSTYGDFEVDLNFAYQLDAPFLISQPGSAGAKVLGKLAGTETVDMAIKSVAKDTYAARNDKAAADKEYERKVEQLKSYEGLDEIKAQIEAAEYLVTQIDVALQKKVDICLAANQLDAAKERINEAAEILDKLACLPTLEEDLKEIEKAQQRYDTLLDLYGQLGKATATVDTLTIQLKEYEGLEATDWLLSEAIEGAAKAETLNVLAQEYTRRSQEVKTAQETLDVTRDLDVAADQLLQIGRDMDRVTQLQKAGVEHIKAVMNLGQVNVALDYVKGVDDAVGLLPKIESDYQLLQTYSEQRHIYQVKETTQIHAIGDYVAATHDLDLAEKELTDAWEAAGGICPLCEQPTSNHTH